MSDSMLTTQNFFPSELEKVRDVLPQDLQEMGADHMQTLVHISDVWYLDPLSSDYQPEMLDIYVEEQEDPIISYENGILTLNCEDFIPQQYSVMTIEVDSVLRYAEIRGKEVFNRLGDMEFPDEFNFVD